MMKTSSTILVLLAVVVAPVAPQLNHSRLNFFPQTDFAGLIPPWKPDSFRLADHAEVIYEGLYGQ